MSEYIFCFSAGARARVRLWNVCVGRQILWAARNKWKIKWCVNIEFNCDCTDTPHTLRIRTHKCAPAHTLTRSRTPLFNCIEHINRWLMSKQTLSGRTLGVMWWFTNIHCDAIFARFSIRHQIMCAGVCCLASIIYVMLSFLFGRAPILARTNASKTRLKLNASRLFAMASYKTRIIRADTSHGCQLQHICRINNAHHSYCVFAMTVLVFVQCSHSFVYTCSIRGVISDDNILQFGRCNARIWHVLDGRATTLRGRI